MKHRDDPVLVAKVVKAAIWWDKTGHVIRLTEAVVALLAARARRGRKARGV